MRYVFNDEIGDASTDKMDEGSESPTQHTAVETEEEDDDDDDNKEVEQGDNDDDEDDDVEDEVDIKCGGDAENVGTEPTEEPETFTNSGAALGGSHTVDISI